MMDYPTMLREVGEATGLELPHFLYAHAIKCFSDPSARRNFMFAATISYEQGDLEDVTEDEIAAYIEDCEADDPLIEKLAYLEAREARV